MKRPDSSSLDEDLRVPKMPDSLNAPVPPDLTEFAVETSVPYLAALAPGPRKSDDTAHTDPFVPMAPEPPPFRNPSDSWIMSNHANFVADVSARTEI